MVFIQISNRVVDSNLVGEMPPSFLPIMAQGDKHGRTAYKASAPASIADEKAVPRYGEQQQDEKAPLRSSSSRGWRRNLVDALSYVPPRCRHDSNRPFQFSMGLNILFAFAGCFTVANLYYNHPILNLLAKDFNVSYEESSYVPTMAQAGYAVGLLLLCPLGDLMKRRPFVLWLVWFTATLWIGLCVTRSFSAFLAITFITSITTVTPQLMLPLVGDMAPPQRRAMALSVVVSGMLFGMLFARFLSGVVARFIGWRYIYWISFALQYLILVLLYFFMPDYPSTNPDHASLKNMLKKYPSLLWDIVKLTVKHPVLMQACLIGFFTSSVFTSYWTTLTFLLAGPPYHYSSLIIGMFALIGFVAMVWAPTFARTVMDRMEPLFSILVGEIICLTGVVIGTYTGRITVVGPIIQAAAIDIGVQTSQIANRTAIYAVASKARNRVNTAYMVAVFCGQLTGTAVGNRLYAEAGWIASGSASVGFICMAIFFCLVRGPHESGWVGWGGGWEMRKKKVAEKKARDEEGGVGQQSEDAQSGAVGHTDEKDVSSTEPVELARRPSDRSSEKTLSTPTQEEVIMPQKREDEIHEMKATH